MTAEGFVSVMARKVRFGPRVRFMTSSRGRNTSVIATACPNGLLESRLRSSRRIGPNRRKAWYARITLETSGVLLSRHLLGESSVHPSRRRSPSCQWSQYKRSADCGNALMREPALERLRAQTEVSIADQHLNRAPCIFDKHNNPERPRDRFSNRLTDQHLTHPEGRASLRTSKFQAGPRSPPRVVLAVRP